MPDNRRQILLIAVLVLVILLTLAAMVWGNYQYIVRDTGTGDFVARWLGTRLFLLQGLSPYDIQVRSETQDFLDSQSVESQADHNFFLYPFYSIYIFFPLTFISNFDVARAIWMTVLELSVVAVALIGINLSDWRIPRIYSFIVLLFSLAWFYSVYPILEGNIAPLVTLLIAGILFSIRRNHDVLAGILLALSTIKPEIIVFFVLFILLWAASWRRWLIVSSFFASLALLMVTTVFLMPNWFMQYLRHIVQYFEEMAIINPGFVLYDWLPGIGRQLGWALTALMALIMVLEWRAVWKKDFHWFYWTASMTLIATTLTGIPYAPINYVASLLAMILVLITIAKWWGLAGRILMIVSVIFFVFIFWLYYFQFNIADFSIDNSPFYTLLLPVFTIFGLYWVRWWAVHKQQLPLEQIKDQITE